MESKLERARALTGDVTPLKCDCGALCGAACCAIDEDGQGGVYLFPGEAALIGDAAWARYAPCGDWGGCEVLTCEGRCERATRPLGCRIFPLTPMLLKNSKWSVRLDARAWAMCPLMASGMRGLEPGFVEAVRQAVEALGEDEEQARFMRAWARRERAYRAPLSTVHT